MSVLPENFEEIIDSGYSSKTVRAYRGTTLHWLRPDTEYGLDEDGKWIDNMQEISFFDSTQFADPEEAYERAKSTARDKVGKGSYADRNGIETVPVVLEIEAPIELIHESDQNVCPREEVLYDRHTTDERELRAMSQVPVSHVSSIEMLEDTDSDPDLPELEGSPETDPELKPLSGESGALTRYRGKI